MIRSEALIEEIRKKPLLWKSGFKQPSEKGIRTKQWLEISQNLFPNWNEFNENEKNQTILVVKKKWKHIRDYYKKECNKVGNGKTYVYSHLLDFLEIDSAWRIGTSSTQTSEDTDNSYLPLQTPEDHDTENPLIALQKTEIFECQNDELTQNESIYGSDEFIIDGQLEAHSQIQMSAQSKATAKICLRNSDELEYDSVQEPPFKKYHHQNNDECTDADRCFLLSLLPEMKNMNGLQKIGFKINVLNELSRIMREQSNFKIKDEHCS